MTVQAPPGGQRVRILASHPGPAWHGATGRVKWLVGDDRLYVSLDPEGMAEVTVAIADVQKLAE